MKWKKSREPYEWTHAVSPMGGLPVMRYRASFAMEALLQILLIFIVFPLISASFAKGSGAAKFGFAILAGAMSMLGALASAFRRHNCRVAVEIVMSVAWPAFIAANASGKTCPACRKRLHARAMICPNCHGTLQAGKLEQRCRSHRIRSRPEQSPIPDRTDYPRWSGCIDLSLAVTHDL